MRMLSIGGPKENRIHCLVDDEDDAHERDVTKRPQL